MNTRGLAKPLSGMRVLIVEDEYYLADDLSRVLGDAGAAIVGPVGTIAEAEGQVEDRQFDCAVLDMNLRGDLMFAVAERLQDADVPFVIATGYAGSSLPATLRDAPRVEKPFAPEKLVRKLAELR